MKNFWLIFSLIVSPGLAWAQISLPFRQFNTNSFLFNPAFVSDSDATKISLLHRQQWLNITDAPVTYGLTLQHPTLRSISFGLTALSTETVALQNTIVLPTVGYKVLFNQHRSLHFGISMGVGMYRLDLEGVDFSNDPTILNAAANETYVSGNFGLLYKTKHWRMAFSFPEIIGNQPLWRREKFGQFFHQFYSVSYRHDLVGRSRKAILEHHVLFRLGSDFQNFWEVGSTITWNELLKAGVSYREDSGLGFLLGVKPTRFLGFNYNVEPWHPSDFVTASNHEFSVQLWIYRKVSEAEVPR